MIKKNIMLICLVLFITANLILPVSSAGTPAYDSIVVGQDYQSIIPAMKNNKWGFINQGNKEIVPFKYDEINSLGEGFTSVRLNNKWGVINPQGKVIISIKYDNAFNKNSGYFTNYKDNKTLYFDKNGIVINDKYPGYDYYQYLSSKYIAVGNFNSENMTTGWGIIDGVTGKELIKPEFPEKINGMSGPPVLINENGLFGLYQNFSKPEASGGDIIYGGIVDKNGKAVLPFEYECNTYTPGLVEFNPYFSDGLALVQSGITGKTSYIDKNGKIAFTLDRAQPVLFSNVSLSDQPFSFNEGMCRIISSAKVDRDGNISYNGKWGFINKTGKTVIGMQYEAAADFYNGLAAVKKNGKMGFINKSGKAVIPIIYDYDSVLFDYYYADRDMVLQRTAGSMVSVGKKGKYGVVNFSGGTVVSFKYDEPLVYNASNGLFTAKKGGKYGFIDKKDKAVIPIKYQSVTGFKNNISIVESGNKYGAVNQTGKIVIPLQYDSAYWGQNNLICAFKGTKCYFFDKSGKLLFSSSSIR